MTRGSAANQTRAGNSGGVEAVVAAMLALPQSEEVQLLVCAALDDMTRGNADNHTRALDAHAALTTHLASAHVQSAAPPLSQLLS